MSAITSYGRTITSYCSPITSYLSAITIYGRTITSYCSPITSYLLAITSYLSAITSYLLAITSYLSALTSYGRKITVTPNKKKAPKKKVAVLALQLPPAQARDSLQQSQLADPTLAPILRGKESGTRPGPESFTTRSKAVRRLLQIWDQLVVHQGALCRRLKPMGGSPERLQTVIPEVLQEEVIFALQNLHNLATASTSRQ